jgi:hypothetical protein
LVISLWLLRNQLHEESRAAQRPTADQT